ncbi:helix-turn-helix transcriptional regulator, partial [Secundilactobacillus kimchicus]|uniref:helix-turn-helix transcriptional regulator n=1 Tax=Secundilactobacillus kimchicus TaxID=528209 RepID=UPI0024A88641
MKFSDILKSKREALDLTQQALADQIYVTRQTVSRWENDLAYPNLDTLIELS